MKKILVTPALCVICLIAFTQFIPADSLYLGQLLPGESPVKFNIQHPSGYVITECIAISPDGKEFCYAEGTPPTHWRIKCFTYSDTGWSKSFLLFDNFTGPAFSPGGDTLFFHKYYNVTDWLSNVYYSVRSDTGWSNPSVFAGEISLGWMQMTTNGEFYVIKQEGSQSISKMIMTASDTTFQNLEFGNREYYVAADESYIIFSSNNMGGSGNNDLFISFRKNNTDWTNPLNLGPEINTGNWDVSPYVTADKKYLFYVRVNTTGSRSLYWTRIDELLDSLETVSNTTIIKGSPIAPNITIYPNPSRNQYHIMLGEIPYREVNIEVCDLTGKHIFSSTGYKTTETIVDLEGFARGLYILRLTIDGEYADKKIVLQ